MQCAHQAFPVHNKKWHKRYSWQVRNKVHYVDYLYMVNRLRSSTDKTLCYVAHWIVGIYDSIFKISNEVWRMSSIDPDPTEKFPWLILEIDI